GAYTISLMTSFGDCTSPLISKTIHVFDCATTDPVHNGSGQILYINVFPNPTFDDFRIALKMREENNVEIEVYDASGKLLQTSDALMEKEVLTAIHVEAP